MVLQQKSQIKRKFPEDNLQNLLDIPKFYLGNCINGYVFPSLCSNSNPGFLKATVLQRENPVLCSKTGKILSLTSASSVWIHSIPKWQTISNLQIKTSIRKNTHLWTSPTRDQTRDRVCKRSYSFLVLLFHSSVSCQLQVYVQDLSISPTHI